MTVLRRKPSPLLLLSLAASALLVFGCDSGPDAESGPDKDRGGALQVGIGQVVTDDLNPDAGDSTDWKSFAVPAPGFLTVQIFWDQSPEIKNAVITVHDKFGAQLESRKHSPQIPNDELVVRVDQGYYFVKITAERGQSIYSIVGRHEIGTDTNQPGGGGVRPNFGAAISLGGDDAGATAAAGGGGGGGGGGAAAAGGGGGGGGAAAAGGAAPAAGGDAAAAPAAAPAGGIALPVAAAGGAAGPAPAAAPAPAPAPAPAAVPISASVTAGAKKKPKPKPQPSVAAGGTAAKKPAASSGSKLTPIAKDVEGPHRELETTLRLVTALDKGSKLKLGSGEGTGVAVGMVGEIYVDGAQLKGGRFKVTKVTKTSCYAKTNAPASTVKKAGKFVIKIPE